MSIGDTIRGAFGGSRTPLTTDEQQLLDRAVYTIKQGLAAFAKVGGALKVIKAKQLYRGSHDTFELFCEATFSLTSRRVNQIIEASEVVEQLKIVAPSGPLPSTAAQASALVGLAATQAAAAFQEAHQAAAPHEPTASQVKAAADRHRTGKKKRARAAKPIRVKVPGATVVVIPNRKAWSGDVSAALAAAIDKVHSAAGAAAA